MHAFVSRLYLIRALLQAANISGFKLPAELRYFINKCQCLLWLAIAYTQCCGFELPDHGADRAKRHRERHRDLGDHSEQLEIVVS